MWYYQVLSSLGVANSLSLIGLFLLSVLDIKHGEIRYPYLLLMVDFSYLYAYIILILIIVLYKYVQDYIGGADLLIYAFLCSRYGYYDTSLIYFYGALFAFIYALIFKKSIIKFIPFIFIGFIVYLKGVL